MASLRAYWRFVVVAWQFLPLVVSYLRDRRRFLLFGGRRRVTTRMQTARAEHLVESLLTLGPTFIKLGQLLSTRPDVLPPTYVDVLTQLQDRVPPAEWAEAREVLEAEVGPVDDAFDDFDTDSISGASLGQVYKAEIDGETVAVKVRRPGIEPLVEADLRVVRWMLPVILFVADDARAFSLETLADEFSKTIREEMDYEREAAMLEEIRGNFADDDGIAIPAVYDERSGERVLTMQFLDGTKISDVETLDRRGVDRHAVAVRLQRAYMQMLVADGVFHADPHPGNLAVQDDGTVVFYDFGMSGRVDDFVQGKLVEFYVAAADQDTDAILDVLVELGALSPEADRAVMTEVMELAIQDARGEAIEEHRVQQIVGKVEDTIYEFPLRLPSELALVLRVATVVEGVCLTLDPDFDFIDTATDYLLEQGYHEESAKQLLEEYGTETARAAQSMLRVPRKLERTLDRVDRDDLYVRADVEDGNGVFDRLARRLSYAVLAASGVFSTAFLYAFADLEATAVAGGLTLVVLAGLFRSLRTPKRGSSSIRAAGEMAQQSLQNRRGGR
ncbi:ABC1 kinase family protein [Halocalculus aciditolerans]|uniref:Membrane protein n=1 Tax=Halocalculus aciditolerans TaxID=1383812 RepID=A0A830FFZ2_9EURY|nr:AarF/ABC1/UbiB kinase family protein [Halocalculus aciditolerans]GGL51239.1 membrane protein [Halocalculus aciditolerans]